MEDEKACSIALAMCRGLERTSLLRLVEALGSATRVWEADPRDWTEAVRLQPATVRTLEDWRRRARPFHLETQLAERGVHCLVRGLPDYPKSLLHLTYPPLCLFVSGQLSALKRLSVGVVGTRRASPYGLEAARWTGQVLAQAGFCVVSGMALGIDAAAQEAALSAGGCTVAVLASGIDICYPPSHRTLYEHIKRHGLLVSEYSPGTPVARHRFPERNRTLAALSHVVVVIQAGERSGALGTADMALELGRDVYAAPGPITSIHCRGSNRLLQDGARLLIDPHDLVADLGGALDSVHREAHRPPQRWQALYEAALMHASPDQLAAGLGWPLARVYAGLLELEIGGWLERAPGGGYRAGAGLQSKKR
ncbi:DNA-processing protein DprA [Alicyclobacillus shizuokensis]|uniref:DNA-processing protein DprA n=1 Tax=Alicyclobacillus shizuokensis TaxID=392014 RepID=UPI0012ECDC77|nr:DNA-processing protein DprA [Alicyclobacillus shizuokensis]MCL6627688.1 DNA-processing protein DprA [Alicyclobacillus shizuokensis]